MAHAYICKVVGTQYDQPFGLESTVRPRRCQRASATPGARRSGVTPATPAARGAADGACSHHTHGSLLEATLCTLAARVRGAAAASSPASPEEVEALALEAAVRRLSMDSHAAAATAAQTQHQQQTPGSPVLPGLGAIPTPTAALAAAPKLQPVNRVHHYGSARAKRSASRRSLFTMVEEAGSDGQGEAQEASSSAAAAAEPALAEATDAGSSKDSPARGTPNAGAARMASAPSAAGAAMRMRSGVVLEMGLSPSRPSLREMAAAREAAAAAPLLDHTWQGRKRLRFL